MKTRFKKKGKCISLLVLAFMMTGCLDKFEDYNTNPHEPETVSSAALLNSMFTVYSSAQQNTCQYNLCMWASFSGHVTETVNRWGGGFSFQYYNAGNPYNDGSWGNYFTAIETGLYRIELQTNKQGVIYAMARLAKVFACHNLLSLYGPIPYTQRREGILQVPYDSEEDAWHALFMDLDEVINILSSASGTNFDLQSVDQFYHGDCTKWLKFANTLKLRMAMRISGKDPVFARQKAEEAVRSGVMESTDDSCWDTTNSGQPNGYFIVASWPEVRANACLTSCMNGYNDPRREKYFTEQAENWTGGYVGVRHGCSEEMQAATYANYSNLLCATIPNGAAPMVVMYAAEAAFLRAEGALKQWDMGGTAQEFYEMGVRLSFDEFEASGADDYLDDSSSKPASYTDFNHSANNHAAMSDITIKWADDGRELERVLTQKWIALFLDPLNGWSDFRRTGFPKIFQSTRSDDPTCDTNRGQRRLRFPQSEYQNNTENVEAAVKLLSNGQDTNGTDLWWALKSNEDY